MLTQRGSALLFLIQRTNFALQFHQFLHVNGGEHTSSERNASLYLLLAEHLVDVLALANEMLRNTLAVK